MRKIILLLAAITLCISLAMFGMWSILHLTHGEKFSNPTWRFEKNNTKEFNAWALLSPIQWESHRKIADTIRFVQRVPYPVAPKFSMVAPASDAAETAVAKKISDAIRDSINAIKFNLDWNYDGQMIGVRTAAKSTVTKVGSPYVSIGLTGTASPEAVKYGFEESIQPGHIEQENITLANSRLDRTATLIKQSLAKEKVAMATHASELQLRNTQVDSVMNNHAILDSMRYVEADVRITMHRLQVTPFTFPILLPFWIALAALLAGLTWHKTSIAESVVPVESISAPTTTVEVADINSKFNIWPWVFTILAIIYITLWVYYFWWTLWITIGILALIILLFLLLVRSVSVDSHHYSSRVSWWQHLKHWWPTKPLCQFLVIWFIVTALLLIAFAIGYFTGHIHFS